MVPPRLSTQQQLQQQEPQLDDLIFLLSIVRNPNGFVAEQQTHPSNTSDARSTKSDDESAASSSPWQRTLSSLPLQRRQIILVLQKLANALHKWSDASAAAASAHDDGDDGLQIDKEADALEQVEVDASETRTYSSDYLQAIVGHKECLRRFWCNNKNINSLRGVRKVGSALTKQLIAQLLWDVRLANTVLRFLDEELYDEDVAASLEKLRLWSEAASMMLKIDKSFWDSAARAVHDAIEREDEDDPHLEVNDPYTADPAFVEPSCEHEAQMPEQSTTSPHPRHSETPFIENHDLHYRMVDCDAVEEVVEMFMQSNPCRSRKEGNDDRGVWMWNNCVTALLLVGEEGCGKTHLLDSIERRYSGVDAASGSEQPPPPVEILRPNYPVDLVGSTLGSSEDNIIALFEYARQVISAPINEMGGGRKCMIMLDDIDQIFSLSDGINEEWTSGCGVSPSQFYAGRRCMAIFKDIMDSYRDREPPRDGHILLLCTSRSKCFDVAGRFDRVYKRGQPDDSQRRQIIKKCLMTDLDGFEDTRQAEDSETEKLLSLIVKHSTGRSASELSQSCREAILRHAQLSWKGSEHERKSSIKRLHCLDKMLTTKTPQSLRGGALDGVVDMRVYTPEELESMLEVDENGEVVMPLLGSEVKKARDLLMDNVIIPLCRANEIKELLYGGGNDPVFRALHEKPIRAGALLVGGPGVGKTSLAMHCAALAARMARVSLLDVSCTSLIHKELGGSERAVSRLFAAARAAAPCIMLLDGIECVAPKRGNDNTAEGTMDRVLSTFMTEMDGVEQGKSSENLGFIGITHDGSLLDPSILRPGRLQRVITLGTPDFQARKELVSIQIREVEFDFSTAGYFDPKNKDDVSTRVAMASNGMSAVEVIAICKEASMECLRELNFEATVAPSLKFGHFERATKTMKGKAGN